MDILEREINKNKNQSQLSGKKKRVRRLLIVCICILIILLILMPISKKYKKVEDTLYINGTKIEITTGLFIKDEKGNTYISLEKASELIKLKYFNGEYGKDGEDKNKCYIQSDVEIVGFRLNSDEAYKIELSNENIEPQYYDLKKSLIKNDEGKLFILLEDFSKIFNIAINISEDGSRMDLNTCDYLYGIYSENIKQGNKFTSIANDYANKKAIYYGMLVVNDGINYGVVKTNMETIIGAKYKKMTFDEYTQQFIANGNNKYGIISKNGNVIIKFYYDDIHIINYVPLLYEVKENNKYGIVDKNGDIILDVEYDEIGYNNKSVLIIKDIDNTKKNGIVVRKDNKYGIANIDTGELIIECELDQIYTKFIENDKEQYFVKVNGIESTLEEYIKSIHTIIVNHQT